jgi:hypothetical protein
VRVEDMMMQSPGPSAAAGGVRGAASRKEQKQ